MADWIAQLDVAKLLIFTLVLTRVSGLVMTAPIFGSTDVPMRIRALLAMALSVLILPSQWDTPVADPETNVQYAVVLAGELLIGLTLGLGITILFSGFQLAGQLIERMGGMMLAEVFDPASGENVPLFSRFLYLTGLAVFLLIGGHRAVMAALLDTFSALPPGSGTVPVDIADTFVILVGQSFSLGIRAAAPVVTALLLSTLVMGLISRTLPQLNILAVGFGANALITFGAVFFVLGASVWVFQQQVDPALSLLFESLEVTNPP
ncbi:MAG: flagellar biosynthetic protein FliR [Planctomycetaceae bacterium]|mgnify:CR=1 FL=1|nr:flagellar biosynthetic protein FliR [Planctomycetaceae bacterium]